MSINLIMFKCTLPPREGERAEYGLSFRKLILENFLSPLLGYSKILWISLF